MRLRVLVCAVVVMVSGCSSAEEPTEEPTPSPAAAAVESESPAASPSVEVSANSATLICEDLRIRDSYLAADSLTAAEEAEIVILEMEANTAALQEDAEPALREIALEHMGDRDAAIALMIPWCQENTEPISDTTPW